MDDLVRDVGVGDRVRFRDSLIAAVGVVVAEITRDYVVVAWQGVGVSSTHNRASLELDPSGER